MPAKYAMFHISCASCGVLFGLLDEHNDKLRQTGKSFYCPNGHSLSYPKLPARSAREEQLEQELIRIRAQLRAQKPSKTPCPDCGKRVLHLSKHRRRNHSRKPA